METFFLIAIFQIVLILGLVAGWLGAVNYITYLERERHDFEDLFKNNPHPEIYEDNGEIYRGQYMNINFEPGYDPDDFDPEDVTME